MVTVLILIHVAAMVGSLVVMPAAVGMTFFKRRESVHVATVGMVLTTIGFITGLIMLFDNPLSIQCALLTGYLLAITGLYAWGFGWGSVPKAKLLKA